MHKSTRAKRLQDVHDGASRAAGLTNQSLRHLPRIRRLLIRTADRCQRARVVARLEPLHIENLTRVNKKKWHGFQPEDARPQDR